MRSLETIKAVDAAKANAARRRAPRKPKAPPPELTPAQVESLMTVVVASNIGHGVRIRVSDARTFVGSSVDIPSGHLVSLIHALAAIAAVNGMVKRGDSIVSSGVEIRWEGP